MSLGKLIKFVRVLKESNFLHFIGETYNILIAINVPVDLAHNTPVVIQAQSQVYKGFIDSISPRTQINQGGSRNPCALRMN